MKKYFWLWLSLSLWAFMLSCQPEPSSSKEVEQATAFIFPEVEQVDRILQVGLLIMDGVYNTELTAPMDILHHSVFHTDSGMKVFTVAKSKVLVRSFEGLMISPDYSYLAEDMPPIDVLIVPSAAHHLDTDLEDEAMIAFVKSTGEKAQYVMSLCDGAFVLAQAGLLDQSVSTTFPADIPAYKKKFPQLDVREEVCFVHDGKFITGAGGVQSFEPALYLIEMLYGKKVADGIAKGLIIDWDINKIPKVVIYE